MRRTAALIVALAVAALVVAAGARAQEWPTRPVTMVVPFTAGGPVDVLGRILAQYLTEVIEYNRAQFELYVALGQPPAKVLARPIPESLVPAPPSPPP